MTTTTTMTTTVGGLAERERLPIIGGGEHTTAMNALCESKTSSVMIKTTVNAIDPAKKTYSVVRQRGLGLAGMLAHALARSSGLVSVGRSIALGRHAWTGKAWGESVGG